MRLINSLAMIPHHIPYLKLQLCSELTMCQHLHLQPRAQDCSGHRRAWPPTPASRFGQANWDNKLELKVWRKARNHHARLHRSDLPALAAKNLICIDTICCPRKNGKGQFWEPGKVSKSKSIVAKPYVRQAGLCQVSSKASNLFSLPL